MKNIIDGLRAWVRRSNERYLLASLSERQLSDIGLDRYRVRIEAAKPFWRA